VTILVPSTQVEWRNRQNPAPHRPSDVFTLCSRRPINFDDHDGWTQIFDGKTLKDWGWGDTDVWHAEDGAIVGEFKPRRALPVQLISSGAGGEPLQIFDAQTGDEAGGTREPMAGNPIPQLPRRAQPQPSTRRLCRRRKVNAGVQQTCAWIRNIAKWNLSGYQADFDYANNKYTGQLYEPEFPTRHHRVARSGSCNRGQIRSQHCSLFWAPAMRMKTFIKNPASGNQVEIIADGNNADAHHQWAHHVCPA